MIARNMEIIGHPPDLAGLLCEAFICQSFVCKGEVVSNANVTYLRFAGEWHRLIIDCGVIFWRRQTETPQPWSIESEGFDYPHIDVGKVAGVIGQGLKDYRMTAHSGRTLIAFTFENGRSIFIENENDQSTFRIA